MQPPDAYMIENLRTVHWSSTNVYGAPITFQTAFSWCKNAVWNIIGAPQTFVDDQRTDRWLGKREAFDSWSSVRPMSCQLLSRRDIGCTEDQTSNSSLFPSTVENIPASACLLKYFAVHGFDSSSFINWFLVAGLPNDLAIYWQQYPWMLGETMCKGRSLVSEMWVADCACSVDNLPTEMPEKVHIWSSTSCCSHQIKNSTSVLSSHTRAQHLNPCQKNVVHEDHDQMDHPIYALPCVPTRDKIENWHPSLRLSVSLCPGSGGSPPKNTTG